MQISTIIIIVTVTDLLQNDKEVSKYNYYTYITKLQ